MKWSVLLPAGMILLGLIALVSMRDSDSVQGRDDRPEIIASFSILADVARQVAGDTAQVTSLMPLNADPHSFQPAPREVVMLAEADVVLVNGAGFEAGLMETITNAGENINVAVVSSCIEILPFASDEHDEHDESTSPENADIATRCQTHENELSTYQLPHMEGMGKLYQLDCGEHHHDGGCDPHVWTNPQNVMYWTLFIRDTLIERDPQNADTYRANADVYLQQLASLMTDDLMPLVDTLPPEKRVLVTNHENFGYFAAAYDFTLLGTVIPGGDTLAEPGAADMAALIDIARNDNVPAIFIETTANPELARRIAEESGATIYTLYTGSLSEKSGQAATYLDYMRYNVRTIVEALNQ